MSHRPKTCPGCGGKRTLGSYKGLWQCLDRHDDAQGGPWFDERGRQFTLAETHDGGAPRPSVKREA